MAIFGNFPKIGFPEWQFSETFRKLPSLKANFRTLSENRNQLKRFLVKDLYLFGSVARDEAIDDSDVDILVEFQPNAKIGLFQFARLQRFLSELLECNVDLATPDALHKHLKEDILKEAIHAA